MYTSTCYIMAVYLLVNTSLKLGNNFFSNTELYYSIILLLKMLYRGRYLIIRVLDFGIIKERY